MRKTIVMWIKACAQCISMRNTGTVSDQLIQSRSLLTSFSVISMDLWSPGDIESLMGVTKVLNCMCDMTTCVVSVVIKHANLSELAQVFMEHILLKFGLCLVVVVDDGTPFMHIFEQIMKALNIRLHRVLKRNHKAVDVERYHRFDYHVVTLVATTQETRKCFVEASMVAAYAWNDIPINGTDTPRSTPAIGRPIRFHMDMAIAELPHPIDDTSKGTVSYMCSIRSDARFARDLEHINQSKSDILYHFGDMVMDQV